MYVRIRTRIYARMYVYIYECMHSTYAFMYLCLYMYMYTANLFALDLREIAMFRLESAPVQGRERRERECVCERETARMYTCCQVSAPGCGCV